MKKILLLISFLLLLTGCNYTELNNLGIVNTLGIDYKNNNYQVYVSIINDDQNVVYDSESNNLVEALNKITMQINKKIILSNIDLLILTENSINYKLNDIVNNFLSNNDYRNNFNIVLCNDISNYFNSEKTDINKLLLINQKETGTISNISFEDFIKYLLIDNNSYIPTIKYLDNHIEIDGYTLIKNYKIFDKLDINQSILFNIIKNKVNNSYYKGIKIYSNETSIINNKGNITINLSMLTNQQNLEIINNDIKELLVYYQIKDYDLLKLNNNKTKLKDIKYKIKISNTIKNNYIDGDNYG